MLDVVLLAMLESRRRLAQFEACGLWRKRQEPGMTKREPDTLWAFASYHIERCDFVHHDQRDCNFWLDGQIQVGKEDVCIEEQTYVTTYCELSIDSTGVAIVHVQA